MTHNYNMTATVTPVGKTLTSNTIPIENQHPSADHKPLNVQKWNNLGT